jgi:nitrogen fixation protein NifQ
MDIGLDPFASSFALRLDVPPVPGPLVLDPLDQRDVIGMIQRAIDEARLTGESVSARLGVPSDQLASLIALVGVGVGDAPLGPTHVPDEEEASVLELLIQELTSASPIARYLPAILARRAMEPNHLWEDLGLSARPDLTALMTRHFAALAARNPGMRWKRFLYRSLCESQGFVACAAPSCAQCDEFSVCFDGEGGESRLAELRRAADLAAR